MTGAILMFVVLGGAMIWATVCAAWLVFLPGWRVVQLLAWIAGAFFCAGVRIVRVFVARRGNRRRNSWSRWLAVSPAWRRML